MEGSNTMSSKTETTREVTSTTTLSADRLTAMQVTEVKTTTTTIFTTTSTATLSNLPSDELANHTKPLIAPSGDFQTEGESAEGEGEKPKAKVVSLQSLIPGGVKGSTLQVEDKTGALAKAASSGAKTVLVVNRDGNKVMLQVSAQPVDKSGEEGGNDAVTSSTSAGGCLSAYICGLAATTGVLARLRLCN
jgi:hypothetical protein